MAPDESDAHTGFFLHASGYVSWATSPLAVVGIAESAVVLFAASVILFSIGFWMAKGDTVARHLWELMITFALYPESLFGGLLRVMLSTVLPAGFVAYLPVRVIRDASVRHAALLVPVAALYLTLALVLFIAASDGMRPEAGFARWDSRAG
ncbi:MAG: ABC-2 family transporter protein [Vicinamibacterales bacterium]